MSQLQLSLASGVSQRHISFLESGKSSPGRKAIDRLGEALGLTLRQRNALLTAGGFAHAYGERRLSSRELAPFRDSLAFMLSRHEPNPAYVMDRCWNLLMENNSSRRFRQALAGSKQPASCEGVNILRVVLDPAGARPLVRDWETIARVLLGRLRAEAALTPSDTALASFTEEMEILADVPNDTIAQPRETFDLPALTLEFESPGGPLRFFTTIATLGTPLDVTLQELRMETLFPADEPTSAFLSTP